MQSLGTQPLAMVVIGIIFGSVFGGLIANRIYDDHFDSLSNSTITTTTLDPLTTFPLDVV